MRAPPPLIKVNCVGLLKTRVTKKPHQLWHLDSSQTTCLWAPMPCPIKEGEFDWDDEMQGYILSSYYYGYAATNILGGYAAARFSARWVYGMGLLTAGVFTALGPLCAYAGAILFMFSRIIVGLASGVIIPAMHVLFPKWFPESERQRITGALFSATYLGTVLSMASSGSMVKNLGWTSVFYIYGGITIFSVLPWFYFVYDEPESHPRVSEKEKIYILENTKRNRAKKTEKNTESHHKHLCN
ncbi:sialin-like [Schistocerca cancellata]|uniref:sialin-like n=1 Tax=Schistocerca cancellata TaxID=274614 RepID=UPI002118B9A6|nr:sialin-like [Schistocerca cancellata]